MCRATPSHRTAADCEALFHPKPPSKKGQPRGPNPGRGRRRKEGPFSAEENLRALTLPVPGWGRPVVREAARTSGDKRRRLADPRTLTAPKEPMSRVSTINGPACVTCLPNVAPDFSRRPVARYRSQRTRHTRHPSQFQRCEYITRLEFRACVARASLCPSPRSHDTHAALPLAPMVS